MPKIHINGLPRIGGKRELKFAIEKYWKGELSEDEILKVAKEIRIHNLKMQKSADLDYIVVGDFSFYDHILDTQVLLGAIPSRFNFDVNNLSLSEYSQIARGNKTQTALEMTKWFDTNYHYLVPELDENTSFSPITKNLISYIKEAQSLIENNKIKPVVIGPLTFLWLGKTKNQNFNKLSLLPRLIEVYKDILLELKQNNIEILQIDEPILATDIGEEWINSYKKTYEELANIDLKIILSTYFDSVNSHISILSSLPIAGIHVDLVRGSEQANDFIDNWPVDKILSIGVIDGRNVWKANLSKIIDNIKPIHKKFNDNLWIGTSCSLLHSPQDIDIEDEIPQDIKKWLSFAKQKLDELYVIREVLLNNITREISNKIAISDDIVISRKNSTLIHKISVQNELKSLNESYEHRKNSFSIRKKKQQDLLNLPLYPTTTIGSFPQTSEIRKARASFKQNKISLADYESIMKEEIANVVKKQEDLGLDVLVHGEPERNDMVEYFGEQLDGFIFTKFGWVQSYGSRCVKPPIIYGDIERPKAMTVKWSTYAQSLTKKPMKGMLTGPVTILHWSFVRDDLSRKDVCTQIAIALNKEVLDLENEGIKVIQIDEPAYREGLPLKRKNWQSYLDWASRCFRISCANIKDETQIHTHMCYAEFNDILPSIASMDADVITIETSRSDMELLDAFREFNYPNDIGPGIYDIHSPRVPYKDEMINLVDKALKVIPKERLWINPDCGLKTRGWSEVEGALKIMVEVAREFRDR